MSEYVAIGALALELGTSCQMAGQIVKHLGIPKRSMRQGKWYKMCIEEKHVPRIKEVYKDFSVTKEKKEKPKVENKKAKDKCTARDNSDKLFRNPIVSVDLRTGVTGGQGIWAYWAKRVEIIREG